MPNHLDFRDLMFRTISIFGVYKSAQIQIFDYVNFRTAGFRMCPTPQMEPERFVPDAGDGEWPEEGLRMTLPAYSFAAAKFALSISS